MGIMPNKTWSKQGARRKQKSRHTKLNLRDSFWWANALQSFSPWNIAIGQVWGRKILGKILLKRCREYMVRCLSMPFGVNTPQQLEQDEGIYYTEVYQSGIVPGNKQIYKDGKK